MTDGREQVVPRGGRLLRALATCLGRLPVVALALHDDVRLVALLAEVLVRLAALLGEGLLVGVLARVLAGEQRLVGLVALLSEGGVGALSFVTERFFGARFGARSLVLSGRPGQDGDLIPGFVGVLADLAHDLIRAGAVSLEGFDFVPLHASHLDLRRESVFLRSARRLESVCFRSWSNKESSRLSTMDILESNAQSAPRRCSSGP